MSDGGEIYEYKVTPENLIDLNRPDSITITPDYISQEKAAATARRFAPYRSATQVVERDNLTIPWTGHTLGIDGIDLTKADMYQIWEKNELNNDLCTTLGYEFVNKNGANIITNRPFTLNLAETAIGGTGPHMYVQGVTGSGKSVTLQTLVAGEITNYSPGRCVFVFIDLKGGPTFLPFMKCPHSLALLTNFEDDPDILRRFELAMRGEIVRREKLITSIANLPGLTAYRHKMSRDKDFLPIPDLVIIVDETNILVENQEYREYLDIFGDAGKIGRSLGVHVVLAAQKMDANVVPKLTNNVNVRLSLQVANAQESYSFLQDDSAARLPTPGYYIVNYVNKNGEKTRTQGTTLYTEQTWLTPQQLYGQEAPKSVVNTSLQCNEYTLATKTQMFLDYMGTLSSEMDNVIK